jgi:hypothetical protein
MSIALGALLRTDSRFLVCRSVGSIARYIATLLGELNHSEHVSVYLNDTRFSFLLLDPCLPDIFFVFIFLN